MTPQDAAAYVVGAAKHLCETLNRRAVVIVSTGPDAAGVWIEACGEPKAAEAMVSRIQAAFKKAGTEPKVLIPFQKITGEGPTSEGLPAPTKEAR